VVPKRCSRDGSRLAREAAGRAFQSWLAQPGAALLDVKVLPMQLVTPPFISREAAVGMAVYSARAILHGKSHDVWEMVEESISQGRKARVQT
jgi:hypothetical protein